jgi:hypothetical protein
VPREPPREEAGAIAKTEAEELSVHAPILANRIYNRAGSAHHRPHA